MKKTKIYNINNLEELRASERKLNNLYNSYNYVRVVSIDIDKIYIEYC